MTASDQQVSPEARLAAALHDSIQPVCVHWNGQPCPLAARILAADPTLAADLALAAAVRERFPNMTLAIEEALSDD